MGRALLRARRQQQLQAPKAVKRRLVFGLGRRSGPGVEQACILKLFDVYRVQYLSYTTHENKQRRQRQMPLPSCSELP